MTPATAGRREEAVEVFGWLDRFRADDGADLTGYPFEHDELWPRGRPTRTAGAVLLAADLTPASDRFGAGGRSSPSGSNDAGSRPGGDRP